MTAKAGPAVSVRTDRRRARAAESFASAAAAIGPIEIGMSVFLVTRGQFSMLDMVQHCLAELGPSSVSVWTWAIADDAGAALGSLMADRAILEGRLIIDRSNEVRSPHTLEAWRSVFGVSSVRVCNNHAKMARVWNGSRSVLLRGSMNMNHNPRFEQVDISEGGPAFELVAAVEDALPVLPALCSNFEAESATGVNLAFECSTLEMFAGLKPWAK